ncbi:substrate-binding domain-containing protein [Flavobacterium sp. Sd200]|uniref:LacI family DNA-binding transcriptional regulator n=1 Tax=Flavobacterium sp. Sd200 TaxID=2692211 RepID=UPI00136C6B77|nr:substrate-binding domain-containing protein [Flavobacterium sp. Sd200]
MKKVSIKDVAQKAGVSIASVSYVLNNKVDSRISKETVDKVKKAAEELGYRANNIAKSLKTQRTYTIGLVVADIANPYFSQIARIIENESKQKGYTLIIGSSDENVQKFEGLINMFCDRQVDGLIIAPVEGAEDCLQKMQKQNIPFVFIDRYLPKINADIVQVNNYAISFEVTQHLIAGGRKNLVLIAYDTLLQHLIERTNGFKDALIQNNLELSDNSVLYIDKDAIDEDVNRGFDFLFSDANTPDAIFFTSNKLAVSGLKKLMKLNVKIPQDVAVVAFDETEAYELFSVPLSFVRQPLSDIGKTAVRMLHNKIDDHLLPIDKVVLNAELHTAASSSPKQA